MKEVLGNLIPQEQKRVSEFRKQHGSFKIGEVTIDMVLKLKPSCIIAIFDKVTLTLGLWWYERYQRFSN